MNVNIHFKKGRELGEAKKVHIDQLDALIMNCYPVVTEEVTTKVLTTKHALRDGETVRIDVTHPRFKETYTHVLIKPLIN